MKNLKYDMQMLINKKFLVVNAILLVTANGLFAQEEVKATEATDAVAKAEPANESFLHMLGIPDDPMLIALLSATIVLFFVALYLKGTYAVLFREIYGRELVPVKNKASWKKIVTTMSEAVPVEEEHNILTDHEYDGIKELDNNLPLWWRYMFYGTILFSFVYLFRYHVFKSADLPIDEYKKEMARADIMKEENRKKNAANVDEENVVVLSEADAISAGAKIFGESCKACHGGSAEGGVGPNLTDEYWLHGGGIKNVFKTIKYGVPDKGMIPWQATLKPNQIQQVASYILSLKGSNPANAKAPQGEIYNEAGSDSTAATITDSTKVALK